MTECEQSSAVFGKLLGPSYEPIEPVGRWFKAWWNHHHRARGVSVQSVETESDSEQEDEGEFEIEDDVEFLRSLDPREWKDQDHYAVLGLKALRSKATDNDIKRAYRQKVLRHHPDKRKAAGEDIHPDDDYFTCITKAYEVLGTPARRRAYDSVDPDFDADVPPNNAHSKANFFKVFGPVFERNSRWSIPQPVPQLGEMNATREEVDAFYDFWYNFESWREFSYLDEEEKDKGQDRDERRWIEKQNKVERAKRKKEEMSRIRELVDNAYACDPRIAKFKDEERQRKADAKKAKQDAVRARQEEEERRKRQEEEAERATKEAAEAAEKARLDAARREKESAKKALKKERKRLRTFCKDANMYALNPEETVAHLTEVDRLCELLNAEQLEALNNELEQSHPSLEAGRTKFLAAVQALNQRLAEEKEAVIKAASKGSVTSSNVSDAKAWTSDDLQLLIKAVNVFPAGTNQRWEVVANFINQHSAQAPSVKRTAKEVLAQAKDLQNTDFSKSALKEAANKGAYEAFEKEKSKGAATAAPVSSDESAPSQRFETPAEMLGMGTPWTADEQRRLEQALKTYPASVADRWDRIAEAVPNRTKKECMKRYKELVELVRAKKSAQASVQQQPGKGK